MSYARFSILAATICVTACSPKATPPQHASQTEVNRPISAPAESRSSSQSADAESVARQYGETEEHINDVAARAAALSGGNASQQDMLDALKAARE